MITDILKKIRHLEISAKNKITSQFSGNYRSAFKGRGIEFADIRPYDAGDDVRDIDWKTTAKQGEMYVKTYHESRDNTLFFVIDASPSMQFSSQKEKKYEKVLEAFALLAFSAVQNGDRVGVLVYGNGKRGEEKIFPPKKGRKHILQILQYCIDQFQNPENFPEKTDLSRVFQKISVFLKHSSTLFWCTGEIPELKKQEKKYLKILRIRHDIIPLLFSDPVEEDISLLGEGEEFSFQESFSGEISSIVISEEIIKNFQKIRQKKRQNFLTFFQKIRSSILSLSSREKVFQRLTVFLLSR